jgi:hypothetical protein
MKLSEKFIAALKLNDIPAYRIAQQAGVNPVTLSKLIHGVEPLKPGDERIQRVAAILGLSIAEAFEESKRASVA